MLCSCVHRVLPLFLLFVTTCQLLFLTTCQVILNLSSDDNMYSYEINVCKSLTPTSDVFKYCPASAGACQVPNKDASNTNSFSLGRASSPVWSNGSLTITYDHGALCRSNNVSRKTVINFVCPEPEEIDTEFPLGQPVFLGEQDLCVYTIYWESSAACAVQAPEAGLDCGVPLTNKVTGEVYQFKSLSGVFHAPGSNGNFFNMNLCSPLGAACSVDPTAFVCQYTAGGNFSAGNIITPDFRDDHFVVGITGGTLCHNKTFHRSTEIIFTW